MDSRFKNSDPILRTKLRLPFIRQGLVTRPRLLNQVKQGLGGPLTLITAPAGFGKTTLAASCVAGCGMPVAWLALDQGDNQEWHFLSYLIAALQEADPTIGNEAQQLLAASQQATSEIILTSLINDLDHAAREMVLVLDDYQRISNQAVHEAVAFLLQHSPSTFHLLISTRSDPPLPLARMRAQGQTVELRAADLRFTETEAAQFLNDVMGLHLNASSVAILEGRTEGWIAGLQMAALSIRNREDIIGFIEGFSGTNRYILDYLLEEVLSSQSPEIQRFLLYTSILERLAAPLCDAILANGETSEGEDGDRSISPEAPSPGQSTAILAYLERANLFLVPLDDERRWYRYHHLFSDLLRARLAHSPEGRFQKTLHARASNWYETNGFPEEAIHHALAAGDYPNAARLIEAAAENAWLNGQYTGILAWINALPRELVLSRPWLCIWSAWAYTQMGLAQDINQWIDAAEQSAGNAAQDAQALMREIAALKVFAVSFSKDYDRAIELAEVVLKDPPLKHKEASQFIRCNILHVLSTMYLATGQLRQAERICQETIELANRIGFTLRYIHAVNKLVLAWQVTGRLANCNRILEESQSILQEQGNSHYFAAIQLLYRKIELLYEWNRLDEAQRLIDFVLDQKKMVEVPYLMVDFYNIQAYMLLTRQDYAGSQNALNNAMALARQTYIWEGLTRRTEWLQTWLWLQKGDISRAAAWASEQVEDPSAPLTFSSEVRMVARAWILLAQNASREANSLLDRLSESAAASGSKGSLIEIRALKAIALQSEGKKGQAVVEMESVLALAEPEGYVRIFIDAGQPMQMLIANWLAHAGASPLRDYALHLLSQFNAERHSLEATQDRSAPTGSRLGSEVRVEQVALREPEAQPANTMLVEHLSPRELEVLRLIAMGKTNIEIAQQLVVARGTIKAHAASINRKLDVTNRTEAVARARQLGILP